MRESGEPCLVLGKAGSPGSPLSAPQTSPHGEARTAVGQTLDEGSITLESFLSLT